MPKTAQEWTEAYRAMTPERRAEVRRRYAAEKRDRKQHPLAYAKLWHRDPPRTSQRLSIQAVIASGVVHGIVLGGNRSGKSEALSQVIAAYALGKHHPDVVRWARRNRLDIRQLPDHPGRVWSIALDSNDSRRYVRPKVGKYLPPGTRWRNRDGTGEAEAILPNGGVIVFKSADQGREGMQGDDVDLVAFDEEPPLPVVEECRIRITDRRGRLLFSMTPLKGWTPLLEALVEDPIESTVVRWIHGVDNPHIPADFLRELLASYGSHERAAREKGEIVALEGRVYPEWDRQVHVIAPIDIPLDWERYRAWDFGTRNPTAILLAALDPRDDVLHIYGLRYEREKTLREHAEWVLAQPDAALVAWTVCDSADRASRLTLAREFGIPNRPSKKGVRDMINAVSERIRLDANGCPHVVVHDTPELRPLIREIEGYTWATKRTPLDQPDAPTKKADHAMDALGYLCVEVQRGAQGVVVA